MEGGWREHKSSGAVMRAGMTRVAAYSSKLLRNVPRWRRSKASTAGSSVTPANALSITEREMPAAAASRPMAARNALKSPPQGAAKNNVQNRSANDRNGMFLLITRPSDHDTRDTSSVGAMAAEVARVQDGPLAHVTRPDCFPQARQGATQCCRTQTLGVRDALEDAVARRIQDRRR